MSPTCFFFLCMCVCVCVCLFFVGRLLLKWTPEVVYCIQQLRLGFVLDGLWGTFLLETPIQYTSAGWKGNLRGGGMGRTSYTIPETNIAPEHWWLEDYFLFVKAHFQGRTVSFREGIWNIYIYTVPFGTYFLHGLCNMYVRVISWWNCSTLWRWMSLRKEPWYMSLAHLR